MRITKWGEYGVLCCVELAAITAPDSSGTTRGASAEAIASRLQAPLSYTQQILHRLRKGGVIESRRGPGGGYLLSEAPEALSLRSIIEAAEGHTFEIMCESNGPFASCATSGPSPSSSDSDPAPTSPSPLSNPCGLQHVWHELKSVVDSYLDQKTLAMVIAAGTPDTPNLVSIRSQRPSSSADIL